MLFMSVLMVLLAGGVASAPRVYKNFLPAASAVRLSEIQFTETVTAAGTVTAPGCRSILTEIPVVISEVFVSQGDTVEAGQALCSVNRDETVRYITGLAAVGAISATDDYNKLADLIPEMIYTPYAGRIESVSAETGRIIGAEGTIATISGEGPLSVEASISEKNISKICEGQQVIIKGCGFGDREYHGTVEYISASARRQYNGTIEETVVDIRVRLDDTDENVRSGYSANLTIPISEEETLRLAPYEAVNQDENGKYVYVFSKGMAVRRNVTTGRELSGGIEITGGLYSADYFLSPAEQLSDGEYVVIIN